MPKQSLVLCQRQRFKLELCGGYWCCSWYHSRNKTELGRETSPVTFQAVNKTKFATFELKSLMLDLGFRRQFSWVFTVTDLDLAIILMNVLGRYELLVNTKKRRLTPKETSNYTKGNESRITSLNLIQTPSVTAARFHDMLAEFPNQTLSFLKVN